MKAVLFSRAAQYDLQDIWFYVADHHPEAADGLEQDIRDEIKTLSEMPDLGHRRKDLTRHDFWRQMPGIFLVMKSTVPHGGMSQRLRRLDGKDTLKKVPEELKHFLEEADVTNS